MRYSNKSRKTNTFIFSVLDKDGEKYVDIDEMNEIEDAVEYANILIEEQHAKQVKVFLNEKEIYSRAGEVNNEKN
jgi:hypothetical protein